MGNIQSRKMLIQIGFSTIAASAIYYIWLGSKLPSPSSTRRNSTYAGKEVLGLSNLGNSCYLNALLQALAASQHYVNYVSKYQGLDKLGWKDSKNHSAFRILATLSKANQYINRELVGDDATMSWEIPKNIISTFKTWSSVPISTSEEQDAQEVFNVITNALIEEQRLVQRVQYLETIDAVSAETISSISSNGSVPHTTIVSEVEEKRLSVRNIAQPARHIVTRASLFLAEANHHSSFAMRWSEWNNPFLGRFATVFQCLMCCEKMPIKFEEFNDLTLNLPQNREMITLMDLVDSYFHPTVVRDVDCGNCSKLSGKPIKSHFSKRMCISKLPRSICFHINRAQWNQHGSKKRLDFVTFPEVIDMSSTDGFIHLIRNEAVVTGAGDRKEYETASPKSSHTSKYKLVSVICHRGGADSGHFVTYRRSPRRNGTCDGWLMVSDTFLCKVMLEQVLLQHAYMMIYDRID